MAVHSGALPMLARILPLLILATAGCAPQNAEISSGSYTAFLSVNTSPVFVENTLRLEEVDNLWGFDCRGADEELRYTSETGFPLPRNEEIVPIIDNCNEDGSEVEVGSGGSIRHENWANRDAFVVAHEELEPWRGEAVMTSENDLNITFHHALPGGDFRFAFAVDPNFAPRVCVERDGEVAFQPVDGDWLANWSRAVNEPNHNGGDAEVHFPEAFRPEGPPGTLFLLNANAYQFDPSDRTRIWSLPPTMRAGYSRARWGGEELFFTPTRYALPAAYQNFDENETGPPESALFYVDLDPDQFGGEDYENEIRSYGPFIGMMRGVERVSNEMGEELTALYDPSVEVPEHRPVVPSNAWRKPDGYAAGLQGWGQISSSWVRFDQAPSEMEVGASLSGNFHLRFFGANSQSQVLVQGRFEISRVKKDRWVTKNVNENKLEENETMLCGERL